MKTDATPSKTEFKFNCPTCGQHILVPTTWIGMRMSCPSCQSRIAIPSPPDGESDTKPPSSPNAGRPTIRIELPPKSSADEIPVAGEVEEHKSSPAVPPTASGNEPWPELVQRLGEGALIDPAALATALFHELTNVRRRLADVEKQLAGIRSAAGNNGSVEPTNATAGNQAVN